jgi:hypothetical protein
MKESILQQADRQTEVTAREAYEAPEILESFEAHEILGVAYGTGQGSIIVEEL